MDSGTGLKLQSMLEQKAKCNVLTTELTLLSSSGHVSCDGKEQRRTPCYGQRAWWSKKGIPMLGELTVKEEPPPSATARVKVEDQRKEGFVGNSVWMIQGFSEGLTRQPKGPHEVQGTHDQMCWLIHEILPSMMRLDGIQISEAVSSRIQTQLYNVAILILQNSMAELKLVFIGEAPHWFS